MRPTRSWPYSNIAALFADTHLNSERLFAGSVWLHDDDLIPVNRKTRRSSLEFVIPRIQSSEGESPVVTAFDRFEFRSASQTLQPGVRYGTPIKINNTSADVPQRLEFLGDTSVRRYWENRQDEQHKNRDKT